MARGLARRALGGTRLVVAVADAEPPAALHTQAGLREHGGPVAREDELCGQHRERARAALERSPWPVVRRRWCAHLVSSPATARRL